MKIFFLAFILSFSFKGILGDNFVVNETEIKRTLLEENCFYLDCLELLTQENNENLRFRIGLPFNEYSRSLDENAQVILITAGIGTIFNGLYQGKASFWPEAQIGFTSQNARTERKNFDLKFRIASQLGEQTSITRLSTYLSYFIKNNISIGVHYNLWRYKADQRLDPGFVDYFSGLGISSELTVPIGEKGFGIKLQSAASLNGTVDSVIRFVKIDGVISAYITFNKKKK
jgi:hypothetical protein